MAKRDRRFFKDNFPALRNSMYLNTGSEGLIPRETYKQINKLIKRNFKYGGSHPHFYDMVNFNFSKIPHYLKLLGVDPEKQIRVSSVSEGLNFCFNMLSNNNIKKILLLKDEFKTGILASYAFAEKNKAELIWADDLDDYYKRLKTDKPDIAIMSHVDYRDGKDNNIERFYSECKKNNVFFIVDGAQAIGNLFIRFPQEIHADLYVWTTHKWLCSPRGLGFINVSQRIKDSIGPLGYHYFATEVFRPPEIKIIDSMDSMSVHAANFIGEIGFVSSMRFLDKKIGIDNILKINEDNKNYFYKVAEKNSIKVEVSDTNLLSIKVDEPEKVVEAMLRRKILIRSIPDTEYIRVSIHLYNNKKDIDVFFKNLNQILGEK